MAFDFSRLRILTVDDNEFMQRLLRDILVALGFRPDHIRAAVDGSNALAALDTFQADLVICDLNMRPMHGKQFTRLVRTQGDSPNPFLPIIVCTGHAELNHIADARDAGANEILRKPVSARLIYDRLCSIVESPRTFVRAPTYTGPDRRRRNVPFDGPDRRASDPVLV